MKYEKQILSDGLYMVSRSDGTRSVELITPERIKHWADQHKAMTEAGLRIPAPDYHDTDANPNNPNGSKSNYGWWDAMTADIGQDEDGAQRMFLNGELDVPIESDAEKIGKTVKETSIYAEPEFVDGNGNIWKDVLTHVAVVVKPIEPNQPNFIPKSENALALSMSHQRLPVQMSFDQMTSLGVATEGKPVSIGNLRTLLASVANLYLSPDVTNEELPKALEIALKQKELDMDGKNGGSLTQPPDGSNFNEVPIVMAQQQQQTQFTQNPITNTQSTQVQQTQQPVQQTQQPVESKTDPILMSVQQQNQVLISEATANRKAQLIQRLGVLKQRGLVADTQIENYTNRINEIQMSINPEGTGFSTPVVESEISALERVTLPMPANSPTIAMANENNNGGLQVHTNPMPVNSDNVVTDERADEIVNALFGTPNGQ